MTHPIRRDRDPDGDRARIITKTAKGKLGDPLAIEGRALQVMGTGERA